MNRFKEFITKHKILFLLVLLALLLRLPWLYTTIERDEGVFGYTTWRILSGDPFYFDGADNKPPFIYILYALPISIFGNTIIPIRMFNNLLFFISIIFFFLLVKNEYGKKMAAPSSVFYILLMNIPSAEGPLAVSESFMMPFFIISLYFFNLLLKKQNYCLLAIPIILMCIASLIRHNALGGLFLLYFLLFKKKKPRYQKIILMIIPFVVFLFLIGYFSYTGRIPAIVRIISNIQTEIPFKYSLLIILESSFILLFAFTGVITILKRKEVKKHLLISLWSLCLIPFLCFPISFHHLLTLAPPIAIFAGIGFNIALKRIRRKEKIFITVLVLLLILSLFLIIRQYPDYHFKFNNIRITYSDLENYQQQVLLSSYIKKVTLSEDKILIWGFEPTLCWLSERDLLSPRLNKLFCNAHLQTPYSWKELEEKNYSFTDLKVIIFLPGYHRKCKNTGQEVYSDWPFNYSKIEFENVEICIRT